MTEHVQAKCDGTDCGGACNLCTLFICDICGGCEGSVPTECPGDRMTYERGQEVYEGKIDFIDGEWKAQKVKWMQVQEEAISRAEERWSAGL